MAMTITGGAFEEGGRIPVKCTRNGEDVSPPLERSGVGEGAEALCLACSDPDAPACAWTHRLLANIPAEGAGLAEGLSPEDLGGMGVVQGANDFGKTEHAGPCPPPGPAHRYYFRLAAPDSQLDAGDGDKAGRVLDEACAHTIDEAELMGRYARES